MQVVIYALNWPYVPKVWKIKLFYISVFLSKQKNTINPVFLFSVYVPESCCVDGKSKVLCQGNNEKYDGPPVYGPPNTDYREQKDNPALHTYVSIFL